MKALIHIFGRMFYFFLLKIAFKSKTFGVIYNSICKFMDSSIRQKTASQIWRKAKIHYDASSVGLPSDMENYELCDCCDQPIIKKPISLSEHTKEFEVFGFGYPLWYSFLKYCIILVLVLIASRTGSQIYMATKQNYAFCYGNSHQISPASNKPHHFSHNSLGSLDSVKMRHFDENHQSLSLQHREVYGDHSQIGQIQKANGHSGGQIKTKQGSSKHEEHHAQCTSFMVYLSIFKGQEGQYNNYFLRILSFVIHVIALVGIRNNLQKQEQYYDERTCSLSDYSVIVSNLPQVYGVKDMILRLFREEFNKQSGTQVKEVIFVFEDEKLQELQKQKQQLWQKRIDAIQRENLNQDSQIEREITRVQKQLQKVVAQISEDIKTDHIKCDKIIVIMNTEGDKGEVLTKFEEGLSKGKNYSQHFEHISIPRVKVQADICIKEAPQPNEINWQHIDESDNARKALILRGWLFTILFLVVVTICFYFIMLAKTNLFVNAIELEHHNPNDPAAHQSKVFATIIVFVALFGVILFNKFVMGKVLHIFVHMERHAYTDKESHSFAMKYSLGMFFTTALMTLAVEAITFKNFYSHQYGVIEEETIMFFVTAFFIPLVWIINPYNLAKKIELKMKENTLVRQEVANQLIEDFAYDVGKRYAQVFEIMWFTFLYSELIPLGSFLVLIGLILYYWVDKFNFLRRSALKAGISGKMSLLSLKSLDATLFLAPAGRVLFTYVMHQKIDYLSVVLTILGLIYLVLPISDMIWAVNGEKFLIQSKTYDEVKYSFKEHYYTLHPVYKLTHKKKIKDFRKQVCRYYKEQYKKINMFEQGRGTFVKDGESSRKQSSRVGETSYSRI